jgi:O-antigen/teichoic acid export membrane protein
MPSDRREEERVTGQPPDRADPAWARAWASDSALLLVAQILTVVATSVAAIAIARTLEPSDWGVFSAFLGLSMALSLVADFGLGTWLLRELSALLAQDRDAASPARVGTLVGSAVALNAAVAAPLVVAAIVWSLTAGLGGATTLALVSLLCYGALTAAANALEAQLRARRRVGLVLSASLLEKGILVSALVVIAVLDAGLGAIGLAYLLAGCSRIGLDGFIVFGRERVPFVPPTIRRAAAVARASFPFALNAASLNLIPRLDTLVLIALSTTSAAWFAIGERALGPLLLVPATLASALYPFMASQSAKRVAPWKLAGVLGLAGAALAVTGIALAPFLVPLLFGDAYEDAVPVAQIMLLVVPIVYATSPLLVIAYSHGRERALLLPTIGLSLAGTVAIVAGQVLRGAELAAAGYVARSALFLVVVGSVAVVAWRRHTTSLDTGELQNSTRAWAQAP